MGKGDEKKMIPPLISAGNITLVRSRQSSCPLCISHLLGCLYPIMMYWVIWGITSSLPTEWEGCLNKSKEEDRDRERERERKMSPRQIAIGSHQIVQHEVNDARPPTHVMSVVKIRLA